MCRPRSALQLCSYMHDACTGHALPCSCVRTCAMHVQAMLCLTAVFVHARCMHRPRSALQLCSYMHDACTGHALPYSCVRVDDYWLDRWLVGHDYRLLLLKPLFDCFTRWHSAQAAVRSLLLELDRLCRSRCSVASDETRMFLLKPLIDYFCWCSIRILLDELLLNPLFSCSCWSSTAAAEVIAQLLPIKLDCSVEASIRLLRSMAFCGAVRLLLLELDRLCWKRCSIASDEARMFMLRPLIDCLARQASSEVLLQSLLLGWARLLLLRPLLCLSAMHVQATLCLAAVFVHARCMYRPCSALQLCSYMRDACTGHALPYIAVNTQQMGGAIDNGGSCCPLLDCFGWSSIFSAEAVVRLPLDKLLLALVLNHACTEAADRLLRMKLDCFCWSRLSIASLDKLLLTLARKHACAEADAQLLRISTVSTEAANWLLRSTIFCWRLCWITLVLRPLVNCFGWILNVSAEAADRILRSACFCWHLCSSTLVLRHACAEAAARLFRTNLDCFCWSCWLIALLDKLLLKFFFNRSSWSSTASAEGCC